MLVVPEVGHQTNAMAMSVALKRVRDVAKKHFGIPFAAYQAFHQIAVWPLHRLFLRPADFIHAKRTEYAVVAVVTVALEAALLPVSDGCH